MRSSTVSLKWTSVFILVLLLGFYVIVFNGLGHIHAQEFTDCDRQTFSLVDCLELSSGQEGTTNDVDDDGDNIEQQIPSVIPFP
jgi:hypothetical protein